MSEKVKKLSALLVNSAIQLELEVWAKSLSIRGCSTYFVEQLPISLLHCIPACDLLRCRMSLSDMLPGMLENLASHSLVFFQHFLRSSCCLTPDLAFTLGGEQGYKIQLLFYGLRGVFIYNNKYFLLLFIPPGVMQKRKDSWNNGVLGLLLYLSPESGLGISMLQTWEKEGGVDY